MSQQERQPRERPIGMTLARTAKTVSRAFDEVLGQAGGSLPTWLIMISMRNRRADTQRELAEAVGIKGATLTHHLNGMAADGLVDRSRDPDNRRVQHVALTEKGEALFRHLAAAASAHDQRLRGDLTQRDIDTLRRLLDKLYQNVTVDDRCDNEPP